VCAPWTRVRRAGDGEELFDNRYLSFSGLHMLVLCGCGCPGPCEEAACVPSADYDVGGSVRYHGICHHRMINMKEHSHIYCEHGASNLCLACMAVGRL
jgi:hypothetical protein